MQKRHIFAGEEGIEREAAKRSPHGQSRGFSPAVISANRGERKPSNADAGKKRACCQVSQPQSQDPSFERNVAEKALSYGNALKQDGDSLPHRAKSTDLVHLLATDTKKRRRLRGYGAVAQIEGHPPYYFGSLQQWYTKATIERFVKVIEECFYGLDPNTTRKYFDHWLKFMVAGAYYAANGAPEADFFVQVDKGQTGTTASLDKALDFVFRRVSNLDDFSILTSSNDRTREGFWNGVRVACRFFASAGIFPPFTFAGTIRITSSRTRTPVLADLSREAGRFVAPASAEEYERAILKENTELLAILRARLEELVINALNEFRKHKGWAHDGSLPSVKQIDEYIDESGLHFSGKFGPRGGDVRIGCAIKLLWAICYEGYVPTCNKYRMEQFFIYSGKRVRLHRMLGANPEILTAAYHILIIDTGWNCQPISDLQDDPFVGTTLRGRRRLRSIGGVKTRARNKEIEAPLEDENELWIPVKRSDVRLTGVQVIEAWQEMTTPLRNRAREMGDEQAASQLWIWRERRSNELSTNLSSIQTQWWPDFLRSIRSDERIGGLPITRRIIRKTLANIDAMKGSFNHQLPMALLDHSLHHQSKMYLTDDTIRALYENKIREYLNLWEAVLVDNLDGAALKLGIEEDELLRRRQLGLSSGLDFALIRPVPTPSHDRVASSPETLVETATSFVPDIEAMENLHIARCALTRMQKEISAANPFRWIRTWLPWHAIVEAIARQLQTSRHRAAFRMAATMAEQKLSAGIKTYPVIW
jgi:hypothetical protein